MRTNCIVPKYRILRNNANGPSETFLRNILNILPVDQDLSARDVVEAVKQSEKRAFTGSTFTDLNSARKSEKGMPQLRCQ